MMCWQPWWLSSCISSRQTYRHTLTHFFLRRLHDVLATMVAEQLRFKQTNLPSHAHSHFSKHRLHDVLAAMVAEQLPLPSGADAALIEEVAAQVSVGRGCVCCPRAWRGDVVL
jgi:hypothetical protein